MRKYVYIVNYDNNQGQRSHFTDNNKSTNNLKVLCIKHCVTMAAQGNMAAIFMTMYELIEKELSKEHYAEGIYLIEVSGLCYGGTYHCTNNTI